MKKSKNKLRAITLGQSLNSVRLLAGMFVISSATLQFIYNKYLPAFDDPDVVRWTLNSVVGLFFLSTFFIKYRSPRQLDYIALALYTVVLFYTVYLTLINKFHPSAVTLVILVMAGGTVIVTNIYFYLFQSIAILLILITKFVNSEFNEVMLIGLFNVVVSIALCGTLLFVRLRMVAEVRFSNSLLEKIQLFSIIASPSGQIIFISPSVETILGYEGKGLLKDGWWKNKNLSRCWIEKEHILNYPSIIPPDIKSIESSAISNDGNTVWLSWTTSILPDGNYMGVAFDITKYKTNEKSSKLIFL